MNSKKSKALVDECGVSSAGLRPLTDREWREQQSQARIDSLQQIGAVLSVLRPTFTALIDQFQEQIYSAMQVNGFWSDNQDNFGQKVALVHSELSELLEANRKSVTNDDKIPDFTGEEAEAADAIIRLLDMAGRYQWRLGEAIVAKMHFNLTRPVKHGKQY